MRTMKIFFFSFQNGKDAFGAYYDRIIEAIRSTSHSVILDPNYQLSKHEFYLRTEGEDSASFLKGLYASNMESIRDADVCMFDCSDRSLSIGTLIDRSLDMNKPTICLYVKGHCPAFLKAASTVETNLIMREYDETTLEQVVSDAVDRSGDQRLKRINFLISPSLLTQLEQLTKKESMTKSRFIRKLIMDYQAKQRS